jgi:hypothetical protein
VDHWYRASIFSRIVSVFELDGQYVLMVGDLWSEPHCRHILWAGLLRLRVSNEYRDDSRRMALKKAKHADRKNSKLVENWVIALDCLGYQRCRDGSVKESFACQPSNFIYLARPVNIGYLTV